VSSNHKSKIRNHKSIQGFTLAEVLVATTISGFIAVIAVGALNAIADGAQTVNRVTETTSEMRFAARILARDLTNLYRDANPQNMKLVGSSEGDTTGTPPFLTFYTVGRAKARAHQPEGDVYEVEYFLGTRAQQRKEDLAAEFGESTVLFRRLWPNPDKDRAPGGILTPIAENIGLFQVRFHDGQQWVGQWTEQMQALPQYVEITLATLPPAKGDPIVEILTVTFPRLSRTAAAAALQGGAPAAESDRSESSTPDATSAPASPPAAAPAGSANQPGSSGGGRR